ncbi:hypothetical protein ABT404_08455 [Streptomyces hyaluromycini]|uniref:Large ATP-binding protein n=1 Tax=Streptomyces hyaluromycini TaxID=1377993 RepID=A0ABV1WRL8_9ACTN
MADAEQTNYLYERLTEKNFQRLCGALLAHAYPDTRCYPVGHSDGGRDMTRTENDAMAIYQVKWTSKPQRNPVTWLNSAITEETDNIRRLVAQGATTYILMTSVTGTAVPARGSMDRLDTELARHAKTFGIPIQVWWRSDIDARLDAAPTELKWAYSDMLAGHDLVRYLIHSADTDTHDHALRALVMKVVATQWEEDAKVKFNQVELTTHRLDDLFIDVEADRLSDTGALHEHAEQLQLGQDYHVLAGAAQYLLHARRPFTLVRGAPGQGKSTLSQYVCQRHRAMYLNEADDSSAAPAHEPLDVPRFPLRVDLRDYAAWLAGQDPFHDEERPAKERPRADSQLENFLAAFLTARSGGRHADAALVHDIVERLPVLIVLDGLDEVAHSRTRQRVVDEINAFTARLRTALSPQVIVTTRPNAAGLAEPSAKLFETIVLARLSPELRSTYLLKWARARSMPDRDRIALERTFRQRSAEPHIAQLADNPMQLTILLYLMQRRANSVPGNRTALYTSYMETFLDREAEKSPTVQEHRADLEEVTAFLGWHLQARAEAESGNGQLPTRELQKAIMNYLFDVEKDESMFRDLFTAVTDRVWALTSKVQGTFEFDVQPVREYFAARYLYEFAGADQSGFDAGDVLRSLVRRGYWLNTLRFYAGFASPNELAGMVEVLEDERDARTHPSQIRTAAWSLLADGVFTARVRSQNRAAAFFLDDLSVRLVHDALTHTHELSALSGDRGGRHLAAELRRLVAREPASRATTERIQLAWRLDEPAAFDAWWHPCLRAAAGTENEHTWLTIGAGTQSLSRADQATINRLALADPHAATAALAAGANPQADSPAEDKLVQAVLDGHASDIDHPVPGYAGDLLRVLGPRHFITIGTPGKAASARDRGYVPIPPRVADPQRIAVFRRLCSRDERFTLVQKAMRTSKGRTDTTSLWGNTARAVSHLFGPCWLAAEIAVIGAATDRRIFLTSGGITQDSDCFGTTPDYGRLLQELRRNRSETRWWTGTFTDNPDPLSRATWVLALLSIADHDIVLEHLGHVDEAISKLPDKTLSALRASSSRLGASALGRNLPKEVLATAPDHSLATVNLLTHHVRPLQRQRQLLTVDEPTLAAMAQYGSAAWPALQALSERMNNTPSPSLLEALKAYGPAGNAHATLGMDQTEAVAAVLDAPFDYPMAWVRAAVSTSERAALQDSTSYLRDIASRQQWFTPHDA